MNLTNKPFLIKLMLIDGSIIDRRIADITVRAYTLKNGSYAIEDLELENCELNKHLNPKYEKMLDNVNIPSYRCFKNNKVNTLYNFSNFSSLNLTWDYESNTNTYINIFLHTCTNSTNNNYFCYPTDYIKII
jgi:hypothetical protein